MSETHISPEEHPDVVAMRKRVAALQMRAFAALQELRRMADADPANEALALSRDAAQVIFALADARAQSIDPDELADRTEELKLTTDRILASLDAELDVTADRFSMNPPRALAVAREIVSLEMAEVTRLGAEFYLWVESHAEIAWREAVVRLQRLLRSHPQPIAA